MPLAGLPERTTDPVTEVMGALAHCRALARSSIDLELAHREQAMAPVNPEFVVAGRRIVEMETAVGLNLTATHRIDLIADQRDRGRFRRAAAFLHQDLAGDRSGGLKR